MESHHPTNQLIIQPSNPTHPHDSTSAPAMMPISSPFRFRRVTCRGAITGSAAGGLAMAAGGTSSTSIASGAAAAGRAGAAAGGAAAGGAVAGAVAGVATGGTTG